MKHLYLTEDEIYEALEIVGLTEEKAQQGYKIRYMRTIIIEKYINELSREEICRKLNDISWRTYSIYYKKSLTKLSKYIDK